MKKIILSSSLFSLVLGIMLLPGQCVWAGQGAAGHGAGSVLEMIKDAQHSLDPMRVESAHQLSMKTVDAQMPGPDGTFKVLARKDQITRYRCSVCHNDKPVQVQNGALYTHSDIVINHGKGENKLACVDCHDNKDRDSLVDKQGRKIDYDHSYQLCGQCHFRQKRDWVGGAHGKREAYWAGERVVNNCTSCHNPHSPAFKTKMPETYSLPLDE
ncbi:MAG: hypothetical protein OEL55_01310 [Desulfobulbaceae bacterium]|nr:hypothetical protein [Desulfobulbaceae bacterium]